MAVNLPKSMQFVEYRPSMTGIPVESVARLYDRLDKQALKAEAEGGAVQRALASQIAIANEGDKPFLQDMLNKMDAVIDQASEERNLPGYSREIADMVRNMNGDPKYATVLNNARLAEEYRKTHMSLAAQHGPANVATMGDEPGQFSSFGPNGELQQFQGFASKRPDYLAGMDQVFMRNVDIVASREAMEGFVDSGSARADYLQTNEGRMQLEDISKQLGFGSYNRLNPEGPEMQAVMTEMDNRLKAAGIRYIKTATGKVAKTARDKRIEGKGIYGSGVYGQSLTDGTDATDATIAYFDDDEANSMLDKQLKSLFRFDRELEFYKVGEDGTTMQPMGQEGQFSIDNVKDTFLTSATLPDGTPMIGIKYQIGSGDEAQYDTRLVPLRSEENFQGGDRAFMIDVMGDTLAKLSSENTSQANRAAFIPVLTNYYDPGFNKFANEGKASAYDSDVTGVSIQREGNEYRFYNSDGQLLQDVNTGIDLIFKDDDKGSGVNHARQALGAIIYNQQVSKLNGGG